MRHGDKGEVLTPHKAVAVTAWVVWKLPVPHCLRLSEGLPDTWLLVLYAHTRHGSSMLSTEPQHFPETPGFGEVGIITVILSGKPPPHPQRL